MLLAKAFKPSDPRFRERQQPKARQGFDGFRHAAIRSSQSRVILRFPQHRIPTTEFLFDGDDRGRSLIQRTSKHVLADARMTFYEQRKRIGGSQVTFIDTEQLVRAARVSIPWLVLRAA